MNNKILFILLLFLLFNSFYFNNIKSQTVQNLEKEIESVLKILEEVSKEEGNNEEIEKIIKKLNEALEKYEEAKELFEKGKYEEANIIMKEIKEIINLAKISAELLLKETKEKSLNSKITAFSLAPFFALIISILSIKFYLLIQERENRKIMQMIIIKKERKESE